MAQQFGGVQGLAGAIERHFVWALKRGGFQAVRCLQSYLRLVEHCDDMQAATRTRPELLSDEDLDREHMRTLTEWVQQYPEVAIAAAREIGWTVIPPGGQS